MKKMREANIELLRIISMILIIAGHLVAQNDVIKISSGFSLFVALIWGSAPRIAVNIFLIIGVWFMMDRKFSADRVLVLYGETWFYGMVLTVIVILGEGKPSILSVMRVIFPFSLRGVWFVSSYIALMLISPFLKKILDILDKNILYKFVFIMFFLICILNFFSKTQQDHWIDNLAWFSFVYLAVGTYKKYKSEKLKWDYKIVGLIGVLLYIFMVIIIFITCKRKESVLAQYIFEFFYSWILDIKSLPNVLCAVSIFYFFNNLKITHCVGAINFCAQHALAVYIIHQTGTFIKFMWDKVFRCSEWIQSSYFVLFYILTVLSIYFVCLPIDWLRKKYVEPAYIKSRLYKIMERKIDNYYSNCE